MPKRKRFTRSKRIKNKKLYTSRGELTVLAGAGNYGGANATIQSNVSYPNTIAGLRWEVSLMNLSADDMTHIREVFWFIAIYREGNVPQPATYTALGLVKPEANVITWGTGISGVGNERSLTWSGSTKSMRKMQTGDEIYFVIMAPGGTVLNGTHSYTGFWTLNIQFFQLS